MENFNTPEQSHRKRYRKTPKARRLEFLPDSPHAGPSAIDNDNPSSDSDWADGEFPLRTPATPQLSSVEKVSDDNNHFLLSSPLTPTTLSPRIVSPPSSTGYLDMNWRLPETDQHDSDTTIVISSEDESVIEVPQTPEEIEVMEQWKENLLKQQEKIVKQIQQIQDILDQVRQ